MNAKYVPPLLPSDASDTEFIAAVFEVLRVRERWTQDALARDAQGLPCGQRFDSAVCWCLGGAALAVSAPYSEREFPIDRATRLLKVENLCDWNDHSARTHAEVVARLEVARLEVAYREAI